MGNKKEFTGTVLSDKMQKTLIVKVTKTYKHPKYGRIMKRSNKYKVHDEKNSAKTGDIVKIQQTRPLSKDKRFKLLEVVRRQKVRVQLKDEVLGVTAPKVSEAPSDTENTTQIQ
jgi:small subunit ribosomal protein S17